MPPGEASQDAQIEEEEGPEGPPGVDTPKPSAQSLQDGTNLSSVPNGQVLGRGLCNKQALGSFGACGEGFGGVQASG